MRIRLNEDVITKINETYSELKSQQKLGDNVLRLSIYDSLGTSIFAREHAVCELEEIEEMIHDLTLMKQAIEENTGLIIGRM